MWSDHSSPTVSTISSVAAFLIKLLSMSAMAAALWAQKLLVDASDCILYVIFRQPHPSEESGVTASRTRCTGLQKSTKTSASKRRTDVTIIIFVQLCINANAEIRMKEGRKLSDGATTLNQLALSQDGRMEGCRNSLHLMHTVPSIQHLNQRENVWLLCA